MNKLEEYLNKANETEVCFYSKEEMEKGDPYSNYEPFPDWALETADHFGEKVKDWGEIYTLIGMSSTFEDYYYILKNEKGKITYETCVAAIEFLEDCSSNG